jgi:hypothetical protein
MLPGGDIKDETVNAEEFVLTYDRDGVVDDVPYALVSVNDTVFKSDARALFQMTFPSQANPLQVIGMNMSGPEEGILLDFFVTVTEHLETIRADVESRQEIVQAIGHQRCTIEKAAIPLYTVLWY